MIERKRPSSGEKLLKMYYKIIKKFDVCDAIKQNESKLKKIKKSSFKPHCMLHFQSYIL